MLRYRVEYLRDEDGSLIATVHAIPGAMSLGKDEAEATAMVRDAALTMLASMVDDGVDIPAPDASEGDAASVEIPPVAEVKLTLHKAMRSQGVSQLKLAALLHTDPKSVRRLLDLYHASRWDHLEMALEALGYRVTVRAEPAGPPPALAGEAGQGRKWA
ncbi:Antitoxin HicB [Fundidesulfovibrio magnetotacticus]|uniref:Antitoxin HicB n=1 Tax=Fundidesulfovibrio magnetotacticus TaxID=2730080 RepID=A0A6V8LWM5_9BACT|nr:type II toxin-antitoxin system HicB family antitoxin [Fundidesulfovibrio magnetotacticus]GFK94067.1 Antitoxin HicB [Fundidesulfovibrio magnetotacticus]